MKICRKCGLEKNGNESLFVKAQNICYICFNAQQRQNRKDGKFDKYVYTLNRIKQISDVEIELIKKDDYFSDFIARHPIMSLEKTLRKER